MSDPGWVRVAALRTAQALREHLERGGIELPFDETLASPSPYARPLEADGLRAGNRFCILPMEGWDGTRSGEPSELTERRWRHFGASGAKLVWGGEAAAVRHDGRANPHQLMITAATRPSIARLREALVAEHEARFGKGSAEDLVVGLQLTHSGRYAKPNDWDRSEPLVAWHHPLLDRRFPGGVRLLSDDELDRLADDFVSAAVLAREGRYGGPFANRTRFLRTVIAGIRAEAPGLRVGVRFSVFDAIPYRRDAHGRGVPDGDPRQYAHGFGVLHERLADALADARELLALLETLGVRWVCTSAGSPYYNPHIQRPALFPPSDGYLPPEDPLCGVARQIEATARLKADFPKMVFVGSAYSYLQEWLPHVGQRALREGRVDSVGLGRMVLSYPELPADVLAGRPLDRKRICRTFSDCTTAPRMGLPSGCYPLDSYYVRRPESAELKERKQALRA